MNPLLVLPLLAAFLASTHAFPTVQATGYQYGIQMDAGSSGTRLYVYKWKNRIFETLPPTLTQVMTQESWSQKLKPGISVGKGKNIKSLLDFAINTVLKSEGVTDLSGVPVFLGATAGMRMLPPTQVTAILSSIQTTVKQAGFMYKPEWIRVLSGEEEGTFGWVAVNSLLGTLQSQSSQTFGALDLGGASTQVTFHPDESILAGLFPLKIAQNSHMLYTHSYLYYGADQARYRMYTDLESTATKGVDTVNNPCFPKGYTEAPNPTHPTVEFVGTSDWPKCLAAASKLITDYQPLTPSSPNGVQCLHSDHERCTFNGVYQPKIPAGMTLLAMSSFFFNWNFFQLKTGAGSESSDVTALLAAAESFCTKDAAGQAAYNNSLPHPQKAPFCYDYCFGAAYSKALLVDGYGLDATKTPIQVVNSITVDGHENDLGWAYGAMLYEINRLGWSYDAPNTATPFSTPFYVSLVISLLLLTVTFFLAFKLQRIKNGGGGTSEDASYNNI